MGELAGIGLYPVRAAVHLLGTDLAVAGAVLSRGPGRRAPGAGRRTRAPRCCAAPTGHAHLTFGMGHAYRSYYERWGSRGRITVDRAFAPPADHRPSLVVEGRGGARTLRLHAEDQVTADGP
ncbi:hypothetical protein [Streptomyces thermolineatus]|uniref:hypothetical protein n=1 Tax=Streptomyces thermolineatus TaxID=44033 RepID=UPI00384A9460